MLHIYKLMELSRRFSEIGMLVISLFPDDEMELQRVGQLARDHTPVKAANNMIKL